VEVFHHEKENKMRRLLRRATFTIALSAAAAGLAVSLTAGGAQASPVSSPPGGATTQWFCFKLPLFSTIHCYMEL
jgi:hypothetical protein